ncbi:MAG: ATP synthase F1 subunit gamma [Clostridia bacterium]|nr:ATP synthase F1 subunit gamma [Clostridia bacterium]
MNTIDLKRRIGTIKETVKITSAMHLISASKIGRARKKSESARRYLEQLQLILTEADDKKLTASPLVRENGCDKTALIVIAGDKGLCGDCNHRLLSMAEEILQKKKVSKIYVIGQESREFFRRKHIAVNNFYSHMANEPHAFDAIMVANDMLEFFLKGEYGEIYLLYTETPSYSEINPKMKRLLPITLPTPVGSDGLFEPHTEESVKNFLSQYMMAEVYSALADSNLAINYKRMLSMQESTKNGEEMIAAFTQEYNHQRQESITSELVTASASLTRERQS